MNELDFVIVSEETVGDIFGRQDIHPKFLQRNDDNSFTATFEKTPAPVMRGKIQDADDNIRIVEPEVVENREPNVEPNMPVTIRFGFIESPLD